MSAEKNDLIHSRRKAINYFLQPMLQIKLAYYTILATLVFAVLAIGFIYICFETTFQSIVSITGADSVISASILEHFQNISFGLYGIIIAFVVINIVVCTVYTHKLIGPTVAFRRVMWALKEDQYAERVVIRKGDAFSEVAEALNDLAGTLESKYLRK